MKLICMILLFTVVTINVAFADADNTDDSWMLLSGYSTTHPGLGETREHVETVDTILRYRRKLKDTGHDWYRGSHDFLIELPVSYLIKSDNGQIFGLNLLSSWTLKISQKYMPYFFVGGGPVYMEANIPGVGANLCGNYQVGLGLNCNIKKGCSFVLEYRFHHISNAGMKQPNIPLNSSKVLIGISFSF